MVLYMLFINMKLNYSPQDDCANVETQMDRLNKQHAEERGRLMEEIRQMQSRATELSIQVRR